MLKAAAAVTAAVVLLIVIMGAAAAQMAERLLCVPVVGWFLGCGGGSSPSQTALDDIPLDYLTLYMQAALTCPGLDWTTLAAIGKIESSHGRSALPGVQNGTNYAGAAGPMQFLGSTWDSVVARHPPPPGGSTPPSPYNPHDAIYAAAAYLCDSGARDNRNLHDAIYAYNHAEWYVSDVLVQAEAYRSTTATGGDSPPNPAALQAINYAQGQLGLPYLWGGDGPAEGGFDCSGLTRAAYLAAGIDLPRTAQTQYDAGPALPPEAPLAPGDLVYYGTATNIHHVALYIGSNQMITASGRGQAVKIANVRWSGDDYFGATRPAN